MFPVAPDRGPLALAASCVLLGLAVLLLALRQAQGPAVVPAPPPVAAPAATPAPAPGDRPALATASPLAGIRVSWRRMLRVNERAHVPRAWVAGFYPLYERAQRAFGVNWLLLASIHRQETAFSTHPTTYRGRNFAGCCAGPMQFNVTNGPLTTWERFRGAYRRAGRPRSYPNRTAAHPSVYDDFDAMMAAASLLSYEGAGMTLDGAAWRAAYDYYGHDVTGVAYADEVLARAIGWSQGGFSINQPVDPGLRSAVDAAWGAPVRAELLAADAQQAGPRRVR